MSKKPLIGITCDSQTKQTYSNYPWYALREHYVHAVQSLGGIPILLPHEPDHVNDYISMVDGIVVTGGDFDIDPVFYGETIVSDKVTTNSKRTTFEFALGQQAMDRNIPTLGICGGMQLLNVVFGGTLIQHIPDAIKTDIAHEQPNPRHETSHIVSVEENSTLHRMIKTSSIDVNSAHHQAIKVPGQGVIPNAYAPDGVIEGFEVPDARFCLGLQWHPEFLITPHDKAIFEAFLAEAGK